MPTSQSEAFLRAALKPKGIFGDLLEQLMPYIIEFLEMWMSSCTFSPEDALEKATNPGIVPLRIGERRLTRKLRQDRDFRKVPRGQQRGFVISVFDDVCSTAADQPDLFLAAYNSLAAD